MPGRSILFERHDDRYAGRLGVADGLLGLRHDAVVGGDDEHGDIGDVGAAGPHLGEGLVAWSIDERNLAAPLSIRLLRFVARMCCVMPPLSPLTTSMPMILSNSDVLPWSTWPKNVITGGRGRSCSGSSSCRSIVERIWSSRLKGCFSSTSAPSSTASTSTVSASSVALMFVTVVPRSSSLRRTWAALHADRLGEAANGGGQLKRDLPLARRGGAAGAGPLDPRQAAARRAPRLVVIGLLSGGRRSLANELPSLATPQGRGEFVSFASFGCAGFVAAAFAASRFARCAERRGNRGCRIAAPAWRHAHIGLALLLVLAKMLLKRLAAGLARANRIGGELEIGLLRRRLFRALRRRDDRRRRQRSELNRRRALCHWFAAIGGAGFLASLNRLRPFGPQIEHGGLASGHSTGSDVVLAANDRWFGKCGGTGGGCASLRASRPGAAPPAAAEKFLQPNDFVVGKAG